MIDTRLAPEEVAELSSVAEVIGKEDAAELLATIEAAIRSAENMTATAERLMSQGLTSSDPRFRSDVDRVEELARLTLRSLDFAPLVRRRVETALSASQSAWARLAARECEHG